MLDSIEWRQQEGAWSDELASRIGAGLAELQDSAQARLGRACELIRRTVRPQPDAERPASATLAEPGIDDGAYTG